MPVFSPSVEGPTLTSLWSALNRFSRLSRLSKMCGPLTCLFWLLGPLSLSPPPGTLLSLLGLTSLIVCSSTFTGMRPPMTFGVSTNFLMEGWSPPVPPPALGSTRLSSRVFSLRTPLGRSGARSLIFSRKMILPAPPPLPPVALLATVADNLASVSFARPGLLSHQMALVNNALASERRMRHQNKLRVDQVARCFYCGLGEDSITHIYAHCPVIIEARGVFFGSKDLPLSSLSLTSFAESRGSEGKRLEAPSVDRADSCCSDGSSLSSVCVVCPSHCVGVHPHTLTETPTPRVSDSITHTYTPTLSLSSDSHVRSSFLHTHTPTPSYTPTHMQTHTDTHTSTHVQTNTHTSIRTQPNTQPNTHPSTHLGPFHSCSISPSLPSHRQETPTKTIHFDINGHPCTPSLSLLLAHLQHPTDAQKPACSHAHIHTHSVIDSCASSNAVALPLIQIPHAHTNPIHSSCSHTHTPHSHTVSNSSGSKVVSCVSPVSSSSTPVNTATSSTPLSCLFISLSSSICPLNMCP